MKLHLNFTSRIWRAKLTNKTPVMSEKQFEYTQCSHHFPVSKPKSITQFFCPEFRKNAAKHKGEMFGLYILNSDTLEKRGETVEYNKN